MIPYDPKSDLLAPGEYPAALATCEEKQSKAGNDMYELSFDVWNGDEQSQVWDYIVMPKFRWKLKRLARAIGREAEYEAGTFDPSLHIGMNLILSLDIRRQEGFDEKNSVVAYLPKGSASNTVSLDEAVERELSRVNNERGHKDDGLPF